MLISQRIAAHPAWLRSARVTKSSQQATIDLRMKIVRAVKMIVPRELLDTDRTQGDMDKQIFGHAPNEEESQRRLNLYGKFSRVPYPLLFVENHTGGILLEKLPDESFNVYNIIDDGKFLFYCSNVSVVENSIDVKTRWLVPLAEVKTNLGAAYDKYMDMVRLASATTVLGILELLLYVNTKNVVNHLYQPSKRENQSVPKPLLPHYSYYVLDVFKDRKQYITLDEVKQDLSDPSKPVQARRAGLVMGHFKKRATGLFWWNNYIRNAGNAASLGVVDKDYRIVPT